MCLCPGVGRSWPVVPGPPRDTLYACVAVVDGSVSWQDIVQALQQGRWHLVTATSTPDHRAQAPFGLLDQILGRRAVAG